MRKCLLGLAIALALSVIGCTRPATTPDEVISLTPVDSTASSEAPSPIPSNTAASEQGQSPAPVDADSISPILEPSAPSTQSQNFAQQASAQPGDPVSGPKQTTADTPLQPEPPTLARIIIEPTNITLSPGENVQFEFAAFDQFGNPIEQVNATWSATAGGSISPEGTFTASTQAGDYPDSVSTEVAYENNTLRANASVVVVPGQLAKAVVSPAATEMDIGATQAFSVSGTDEYGNELSELAVKWRVSPGVGFIDNQGLITSGTRAGTFPESVSAVVSDGTASKEAYARVTIRPDPLDRIEITPAMITIDVDATQRLSARAFDQYQNQIPGISFAWTIAPEIGQIHPDDRFTADIKAGTFTNAIIAEGTFRGEVKQGSATVTILPGPLASLRIEPGEIVVVPLEEVQLRAVGIDAYNNPLADLVISWSSDSVAGSVDTSGRLTSGTKANTYPEAVKLQGEYGGNTLTAFATVTNLPGPLASLRIEPGEIVVVPLEEVQLRAVGIDAYNNPLTDLMVFWGWNQTAGNVDAAGKFTAGTLANIYPEAIRLQGEYGGVTMTASANVKIHPGPMFSATLSPGSTTLFTGDETAIAVNANDQFGNKITTQNVTWTSTAGSVQGGATSSVFVAGREPGQAIVTANLPDGLGGSKSASVALNVNEGYCETRRVIGTWDVTWWTVTQSRTFGTQLGTRQGVTKISKDWQYNALFAGLSDHVGLTATTQLVVRKQGPVFFSIGGDDGYRVKIDGVMKPELSDWRDHSFYSRSKSIDMSPGIYRLEVEYYDWTALARLGVSFDKEVWDWDEVTQCFGGYVRLPDSRYVLYGLGDSESQVADRFGVEPGDILARKSGGNTFLVPGKTRPPRKIIVLQGIDSAASCSDVLEPNPDPDSFATRANLITRAIQSHVWDTTRDASAIDSDDLIGFSYADKYQSCQDGLEYSARELTLTDRVYPVYTASDTCGGVAQASERLKRLMDRIVELEPEVQFDLVGHSMGGMVAAHLAATFPEFIKDNNRVRSVITLDSPLRGFPTVNFLGFCADTTQAGLDITRRSSVVGTILSIDDPTIKHKFIAINSSPIGIGNEIPGTVFHTVDCSTAETIGLSFFGALIGSLVNPYAAFFGLFGGAAYGEYGVGHSCVWADDTALNLIAKKINRPTQTVPVLVFIESYTERVRSDPFGGFGDPYFVITANAEVGRTPVKQDTAKLTNIGPVILNVPADSRYVRIEVQAWDADFDADDQYDISSKPGSGPGNVSLVEIIDLHSGVTIISGDGMADGSSQGLQAAVTVRIESP